MGLFGDIGNALFGESEESKRKAAHMRQDERDKERAHQRQREREWENKRQEDERNRQYERERERARQDEQERDWERKNQEEDRKRQEERYKEQARLEEKEREWERKRQHEKDKERTYQEMKEQEWERKRQDERDKDRAYQEQRERDWEYKKQEDERKRQDERDKERVYQEQKQQEREQKREDEKAKERIFKIELANSAKIQQFRVAMLVTAVVVCAFAVLMWRSLTSEDRAVKDASELRAMVQKTESDSRLRAEQDKNTMHMLMRDQTEMLKIWMAIGGTLLVVVTFVLVVMLVKRNRSLPLYENDGLMAGNTAAIPQGRPRGDEHKPRMIENKRIGQGVTSRKPSINKKARAGKANTVLNQKVSTFRGQSGALSATRGPMGAHGAAPEKIITPNTALRPTMTQSTVSGSLGVPSNGRRQTKAIRGKNMRDMRQIFNEESKGKVQTNFNQNASSSKK